MAAGDVLPEKPTPPNSDSTTGFAHRPKSTWTFQRNVQFLEDYWRFEAYVVAPAARQQVRTEAVANPGLWLSDLVARTKATASPDDIYRLIAAGDLYVDLEAAALVEPEKVRIFPNPEVAAACKVVEAHVGADSPLPFVRIAVGSSVTWDSRVWKIVNLGERRVSLLGEDGPLTEIPLETFEGLIREDRISAAGQLCSSESRAFQFLVAASEDDLKVANRRYDIVQRHLNGERLAGEEAVPERTLRFWMARYRQAEEQYENGYVGLIPKTRQRGNRGRKLSVETQAFVALRLKMKLLLSGFSASCRF
jgi:hypothetical protein